MTRILIVDAEPAVRTVVSSILERDGYEVFQTADPRVALELVKSNRPALIITNVALPGITGHDAMQIFKQYAPEVPVLMISGLPDSDVISEWIHQPGFDVFPKPFEADALSSKVREVLKKPYLQPQKPPTSV